MTYICLIETMHTTIMPSTYAMTERLQKDLTRNSGFNGTRGVFSPPFWLNETFSLYFQETHPNMIAWIT